MSGLKQFAIIMALTRALQYLLNLNLGGYIDGLRLTIEPEALMMDVTER